MDGHARSVRFVDGATVAGGVEASTLTSDERREILAGRLGYCEAHRVLYRKEALVECPVPLVCENTGACREWKAHE